ncbi:hypothetical protein ACWF82_14930 [Nocardia sp. NPDC055053]
MSMAVVGAAVTFPLATATPALALPAAVPDLVQTDRGGCNDWNRGYGYDRCDRNYRCDYNCDRNYRCDNDWYGRGYDRCDRGHGGGYGGGYGWNNWFPWGWFGSS